MKLPKADFALFEIFKKKYLTNGYKWFIIISVGVFHHVKRKQNSRSHPAAFRRAEVNMRYCFGHCVHFCTCDCDFRMGGAFCSARFL